MEQAMTTTNQRNPKRLVYKWMDSPVGRLRLVASDEGLAGILWERERPNRVRMNVEAENNGHSVLVETERQLNEYFGGQRKEFALKLDFVGTAFQREVWNALLTIPFGETRTYGQIARHIGNPSATRAVGAANGRNPISIVAPCHRVIGSTGTLTGFSGGLDAKAYLLTLEGAYSPTGLHLPPRLTKRTHAEPRHSNATVPDLYSGNVERQRQRRSAAESDPDGEREGRLH
jgi:methylated-DNA-[protein]-cysteine S-methyltransferase